MRTEGRTLPTDPRCSRGYADASRFNREVIPLEVFPNRGLVKVDQFTI